MAGELDVSVTQQERIRRVLFNGPAFPDEVAATTGYPMRVCSAVLNRLWKRGAIVRSPKRVARDDTNSAYLYSIRHRQNRVWTTRDIARLRELAPTTGPREIARVLGRTESSIWNQAYRLGITMATQKKTQWPMATKIEAAIMRKNGASFAAISRKLGVPVTTVQAWSYQ